MNFRESIFQSLESLKANKIRSFLTLLALVIGVFSVIVSTTAVAVLDNFFANTLSILGSNVITVQRTPAVQMGSVDKSIRNRKDIRFQDAERLEDQIELAEGLAPLTSFSFTRIKYKDRETDPNISVRGSNGEFIENNAFKLQDGRNITEEDLQYKRNVVILGKDVQTELFENEYPLNKEVRIDGQPYLVIGLLEKKGQVFGSSFDNLVIIPYTTGINVYGGKRGIGIQVRAPEIGRIQETIEEITGIMRVIRGVGPLEDNDFEVITNDSLSGSFDSFTGVLYVAGFAIGFITLLGAGIGVMNIMLVSVTERTREIGIRKSVGATKKAIIMQFLLEAVFLCQIGGIIGMILGVGAGNVVAILIEAEPVVPLWSVIGSFLGMTVVGIIFGVYPAFKAAQLDPIESLRYE